MPDNLAGAEFVSELGGPTSGLPDAPEDTPEIGSVVGLLASHVAGMDRSAGRAEARVMSGILESWQSETGGLTMMAHIRADASTIQAASGTSLWGSFFTPAGALIVVAALARELPSDARSLELTGVRMIAYEPRRRSARAGLERPVLLRSGGRTHQATTLDLSRGGCRVFTSHPGDPLNPGSPGNLHAGYELSVELELDDGHVLAADALVVRADGPELALRFTNLAATDAAEVDAAVFRELVRAEG